MTDPVVALAARAAARRLATDAPARAALPGEVELALHAREFRPRGPEQYGDPTALGSLIVSVATLAWTVYNDIRSRTGNVPGGEVVGRRVRGELDRGDGGGGVPLGAEERERVVEVTVEETVAAARDAEEAGEA
jgi:hypothetical protein